MGVNLNAALDVAELIDARINSVLENVMVIKNDGDGTNDVSTLDNKQIFDADGNAVQAGTYVSLDGMPSGETLYDSEGNVIATGVFDMGSTEGALAVGLYQQM